MSHTKGVWSTKELKNSGKIAITVNGKNHFLSNGYGNIEANARLLAAAPSLLDVVEEAIMVIKAAQKNKALTIYGAFNKLLVAAEQARQQAIPKTEKENSIYASP